jgi:hypothetical protein
MRMVRPEDVLEAVTWYCGVDPEAQTKLTYRGRYARRVVYAVLRFRLGMGTSDIAKHFGRNSSSIIRTMGLQPIDADVMDEVYARAQLIVRDKEHAEAQHRSANRIVTEAFG